MWHINQLVDKMVKIFKNIMKSLPKKAIPISLVAIAIAIFLLSQGHPPEFFDIPGIAVFIFLTILGGWMLATKKEASDVIAFVVLLIGILGLVVDGFIVFGKFFIGG